MSHSCDEQYAIYDEREFRANKPHTCDACGLEIPKRHRYTRVFMLYEGRKEHVKRCARCQLLHEHLRGLCEPGEQWPDERLNCGLSYESEWGPAPTWVNELAFWRPGDPLPATNRCMAEPNAYEIVGPVVACRGNAREWNPATGHCRTGRFDWQRQPQPSGQTEVCS
jgi:hypothetical protein